MYLDQRESSGHGVWRRSTENRKRYLGLIAGSLLMPALLMAYPTSPPLALTGAPGEGTCASCHGSLTSNSTNFTVTISGGTTYSPGGAAETITLTIPTSGGFEMSSRVMNDNSQGGTLAAGTGSASSTSGSIQYVYQNGGGTSWTFSWTPPATNVGNVVLYFATVSGTSGIGNTYTNTFTLTPSSTAPPDTLAVSSSALTFTVNGAQPAGQTVQVTSSGASLAFTTSSVTTSGGNWLSASPTGGNTPLGVTVSANASGLAAGTYDGTVSVASTGASNSPLSISVILNVVTPIPPSMPTIASNPPSLSFSVSAPGGTAAAQNIAISSSGSSALAVAAAPSTMSGGNWLSVTPATGTTPASFSVSVTTTGLAAGTYMGSIALTATGASNSPLSVPVTLTVGSTTTNVPALQYSFNVVDKQSGGTDSLLLSGSGGIDNSGNLTGRGSYQRYKSSSGHSEGSNHTTVSLGTWTAVSVVSYTPMTPGTTNGGVLVLKVNLHPNGGSTMPATMRIADSGSDMGVTLVITGGDTFMPTGTGRVSISPPATSCPSPGTGGGRGEDGTVRTPVAEVSTTVRRTGSASNE